MSQPDEQNWTRNTAFRMPEWVYVVLAVLLIGLVGWFYAQAIDTEILGFIHDDGVYAITGKAMATGKGFSLLHVVGQPAQVKYPFGYPAILSLVWLIHPRFPDNLILMNAVTILFTMAAFWIIYRFLRKYQGFPGWLALLVIPLVACNFFFIYFHTSVMSEAPYLFFSMLTLLVFYHLQAKKPVLSFANVLLLSLLSVATFLIRVPGIALMAAIGTWFLLNRQWKNALLYGACSFVLGVLPWTVWIKTQTPAVTPLNYPLVNAYSNYGLEFIHNFHGGDYLASLEKDFVTLMGALLEIMFPLIPNLFKIYKQLADYPSMPEAKAIIATLSTYLLLGYFLLQGIRTLRQSLRDGITKFSPAPYSVPGLYLFFYIAMITLWTYEDQMTRFLCIVTPLLWLFFFKPILPWLRFSDGRTKAWLALAAIVVTGVISLLPASNSYRVIHRSRSEHWVESGKYKWMWEEYRTTFAHINQSLPIDAKLAVASDTVFYLYTNRPTFYVFYASLPRKGGRFLPDATQRLMRSLDHYGMQYLVVEPHMQFRTVRYPENKVAKSLLQTFPARFKRVYASPNAAIHIYRILPRTS